MCSTYLMVGIDFVSDLISAKASRLASMWGRKAGSMTETDVGVQINERQVQQRKERSAMWGRLEERRGNGKIPTGGWTDDNDYDDDALNRVQVKMQSVSLSSK